MDIRKHVDELLAKANRIGYLENFGEQQDLLTRGGYVFLGGCEPIGFEDGKVYLVNYNNDYAIEATPERLYKIINDDIKDWWNEYDTFVFQ